MYIKEPAKTADNATPSYVNGKRITDVPGPRPVTGLQEGLKIRWGIVIQDFLLKDDIATMSAKIQGQSPPLHPLGPMALC